LLNIILWLQMNFLLMYFRAVYKDYPKSYTSIHSAKAMST
jgi:hypothetical protein